MENVNEWMELKVRELKKLEEKKSIIDSKIESIKKEIQDEMTTNNTYEYSGEDWKVTRDMVSSNRFDQSAFKAVHPRLFEQFKKLSESRRFITEVK